MSKFRLYLWLIRVNLYISAFTFGGGYVVVPMIRKYFVEEKGLFSKDELMDMAAIAQSSPGAIAINLSVLAGKRAAGYPGAFLSAICGIIPSIVILAFISGWYVAFSQNVLVMAVLRGMQACVAAMIVDLLVDMVQAILGSRSWLLTALIPASFVAATFFNVNVVWILGISSLLCILQVWRKGRVSEVC